MRRLSPQRRALEEARTRRLSEPCGLPGREGKKSGTASRDASLVVRGPRPRYRSAGGLGRTRSRRPFSRESRPTLIWPLRPPRHRPDIPASRATASRAPRRGPRVATTRFGDPSSGPKAAVRLTLGIAPGRRRRRTTVGDSPRFLRVAPRLAARPPSIGSHRRAGRPSLPITVPLGIAPAAVPRHSDSGASPDAIEAFAPWPAGPPAARTLSRTVSVFRQRDFRTTTESGRPRNSGGQLFRDRTGRQRSIPKLIHKADCAAQHAPGADAAAAAGERAGRWVALTCRSLRTKPFHAWEHAPEPHDSSMISCYSAP